MASSTLDLKTREVNWLVGTKGCRRQVLGQCLDGDSRDCKRIDGAVLCDNCLRKELEWRSELSSQGIVASAAYGRKVARGLERLEAALEEIEAIGQGQQQGPACRICWMFEGAKAAATHGWYGCPKSEETVTFAACMEFQGKIKYRKDTQARFLSCFYCHVSQELCRDGYKGGGRGCRWKHVVMPVAYAACQDEDIWLRLQKELAGREIQGEKDYVDWLGSKQAKPVHGQEMTNAMAVFDMVLKWRQEENIV
jgi:hypothetical protein